jgi:hypothetical protein
MAKQERHVEKSPLQRVVKKERNRAVCLEYASYEALLSATRQLGACNIATSGFVGA